MALVAVNNKHATCWLEYTLAPSRVLNNFKVSPAVEKSIEPKKNLQSAQIYANSRYIKVERTEMLEIALTSTSSST